MKHISIIITAIVLFTGNADGYSQSMTECDKEMLQVVEVSRYADHCTSCRLGVLSEIQTVETVLPGAAHADYQYFLKAASLAEQMYDPVHRNKINSHSGLMSEAVSLTIRNCSWII